MHDKLTIATAQSQVVASQKLARAEERQVQAAAAKGDQLGSSAARVSASTAAFQAQAERFAAVEAAAAEAHDVSSQRGQNDMSRARLFGGIAVGSLVGALVTGFVLRRQWSRRQQ